jgi:hypothetical protein
LTCLRGLGFQPALRLAARAARAFTRLARSFFLLAVFSGGESSLDLSSVFVALNGPVSLVPCNGS